MTNDLARRIKDAWTDHVGEFERRVDAILNPPPTEAERSQEAIRADLIVAQHALSAARERVAGLDDELNRALVRDAGNHEWLGKKVRRRVHSWGDTYRTQTGIVAKNEQARRVYYRGHMVEPGETFVLSASGTTAYRFAKTHHKDGDWELV